MASASMLQELSTRLGSQQNNLDKDSSSVKSSGSAGSRHTGSPKSPGSRNTGSLKDPGNKSDTKPPKPPKPPKPSKPLPVTRSKSQEPEKIDSIDNDMSTATKDNRKGKKGGMFKKVKNMFKRKGSGKENSEPILKSSRAKSESDLTMADDKEQLDLHGSSSVLDQNDANADPSARNAKNKRASSGFAAFLERKIHIRRSLRAKLKVSKDEKDLVEPMSPGRKGRSKREGSEMRTQEQSMSEMSQDHFFNDDSFFTVSLTPHGQNESISHKPEFMALDDLSPVSTASSPPSGLNVAKDRIRVAPQNRRKPARFRPAKANSSSTSLEDGAELDTSVSPLVSVKEDSDIKELEVDGSDHSPQDDVVNSKTESTPFDQACKADLEDVVLSTNEVQKSASAEVEHGPLLEGMQELLDQFSGDRRSQEKKINTDENEVQLLATKNERDKTLNEKCGKKKLANLRPSPHRSTSESKVPVLKKIIDDTESKTVLERNEERISPPERYPFKNRSQSHLEKEKSPSIDDFLLAEKSCLEAENEIKKENSTLTISNGNVSSKKEIREIEHDSLSSPFDKLVSRSKLAQSETNPTVEFGLRKTEPSDFRSKPALSNNTSVNKVFSKQFSLDNDDFRSVDVHSEPFTRSYSLSSHTVKENSAQDHLSKSKSLGFGLPKAEEKESDKELVKSGEPDWITIAKEKQRRNTIEEEEFLKSEAEDKQLEMNDNA